MRRFEFVEGSSSKFWEIELEDKQFTVRWGRIGTAGQTQTKDFASADKAKAEHDKLIKEKTTKGYVESGASVAPAAKPAPAPAPAPVAPAQAAPVQAAAAAPVVAPPPAPVAQKAQVKPKPTGGLWSTDVSAQLLPKAGAPAPKLDAEALWTRIAAMWKPHRSAFVKGKADANVADVQKAVVARLDGARPTAPAADVEVEAAVLHVTAITSYAVPVTEQQDVVVDWWVALGGLPFAVRAMVAAQAFHAQFSSQDAKSLVREIAPGPFLGVNGAWIRLRRHFVAADPTTVAQVRAIAAAERARGEAWRLGFAILTDDGQEAEQVADEMIAGRASLNGAIFLVLRDADRALRMVKGAQHLYQLVGGRNDIAGIANLVENCGADAAEVIARLAEDAGITEWKRDLGALLATINASEAVEALISRAADKDFLPSALEASVRSPALALAPLARTVAGRGKASSSAQVILERLMREDDGTLAALVDTLPEASRIVARNGLAKTAPVAEAGADELPAVLASPPWSRGKKAATKKVVLEVAPLPFEPTMTWRPGQKDEWAAGKHAYWTPEQAFEYAIRQLSLPPKAAQTLAERDDPAAEAAVIAGFSKGGHVWGQMLTMVPDRLARVLVRHSEPGRWYMPYAALQHLATRWELSGLDDLLRYAEASPKDGLELMRPFRSPRIATLAAHALAHLKTARDLGRGWLLAHPEAAIVGLVPAALKKPSKERDAAETGLRFLAAQGHEALILEVAARWSPEVVDGIRAVLDFDALDLYPSKLPKLPEFWSGAAFSRPLLPSGKALPVAAIDTIGTMLAFSSPELWYEGLLQVKAACTPSSLASFAWDLFSAWQVAGWPSKEGWAFRALGLFGDDETARRIAPLIRAWPGEAAHARAVSGLDVLAGIGTDVALMHLNGIAQKVKFKGLQERAREKIADIADARGLTPEELADRLVPDLGLDEKGSMQLDFGPRQFTVSFDELLKPFVKDGGGKRLPDLPKPGKSDDDEKSKAAVETYKALKKDAKTLASQQLVRLELAMCSGRRWTPDVFANFLAGHPLLGHLVRRLIWGVYDAENALVAAFRVAEDGTYSDENDDGYDLPADAKVGIAHPLDLPDALAAGFGQQLADYEILQPFRQLGREAFRLTDAERQGKEITRYEGLSVPTGKVLGLESKGWVRGAPQDAGVSWWYEKPLPNGLQAMLTIEPGIVAGAPDAIEPNQKLQGVTLVGLGQSGWNAKQHGKAFSEIGVVSASELLRDLEALRG